MQLDKDIIVGFIVLGTAAAIIIVVGISIGALLG